MRYVVASTVIGFGLLIWAVLPAYPSIHARLRSNRRKGWL